MSLLWYSLLIDGYKIDQHKINSIRIQKPKIVNVEMVNNKIKVTGTAKPNTKLKITIKKYD